MSKNNLQAYGKLCGLFYDATEKYASEDEVNFFASFVELYPGRVLEAMSGSGRLQIPLMQRGYVVDGVDHSYAMLARCRQRCAKLEFTMPQLYEQSLENMKSCLFLLGSKLLTTERQGFEPWEPLRTQHISSVLLSATQPPLQTK